ncbi:arylsulfatase B-like [Glandiceps talaboti]
MWTSRSLCQFLALLAGLVGLQAQTRRPANIVMILADDLGWNDIGYHNPVMQTPYLNNLAEEGVKLHSYYMPSICTPSRSVFLTGRYEIRYGLQHGVLGHYQRRCLSMEEGTIAQHLQQRGYSTHLVGKWHLGFYKDGCLPRQRGFDSFFGFYLGAEDYFHHDSTMQGHHGYDFRRNEDDVSSQYLDQYSTHLFAEEAQEIIKNHDPNKPLFLFLSFQAVHMPLQVPEKYAAIYDHVYGDNKDWRTYGGMVTCMDEAVGNVTRTLKQSPLWDNTVLIFSTDNGADSKFIGSNFPLRGSKATLFEGGVRGVGFVNSPLLSPEVRGTTNRQLLHMSDWFPTFLHLSGGEASLDKPIDGFNQWETISQGKQSPRQEILHTIDTLALRPVDRGREIYSKNPHFDVFTLAALRLGDWKLLTGPSGNDSWIPSPSSPYKPFHPKKTYGKVVRLYNIAKDPYERKDVSEENPEIVMELLRRLGEYNKDVVKPNYPGVIDVIYGNPDRHDGLWAPWG